MGLSIGIYFDGLGGSDAAKALAQAARTAGHRALHRDTRAWRDDCVERFGLVVIVPGEADASAISAAYEGITHVAEAATPEALLAVIDAVTAEPAEPEPEQAAPSQPVAELPPAPEPTTRKRKA